MSAVIRRRLRSSHGVKVHQMARHHDAKVEVARCKERDSENARNALATVQGKKAIV